ncbi:MAG: VCBS repeat-containing protein, partial [Flavobacteriaceae bacterium]
MCQLWKHKIIIYIGLTLGLAITFQSCEKSEEKLFVRLASKDTGITFKNVLKDTPDLNILTYLYYYNGGGVAAADFNNDDLIDLYFTANQSADKLYLNKGNFVFEDITEYAGIHNLGNWTTGVTHVDINNDGLEDIYICRV